MTVTFYGVTVPEVDKMEQLITCVRERYIGLRFALCHDDPIASRNATKAELDRLDQHLTDFGAKQQN